MMDYEAKAREVARDIWDPFRSKISFREFVAAAQPIIAQAIREAVEGEWQRGYASGFRNGVDATPQSPPESPKSKPEGSK